MYVVELSRRHQSGELSASRLGRGAGLAERCRKGTHRGGAQGLSRVHRDVSGSARLRSEHQGRPRSEDGAPARRAASPERASPRRGGSVLRGEASPFASCAAFLLARLANFVEGNSGISLPVAEAVADMLDGRILPPVPGRGNGAAGEINALGHLFFEIADRVAMGPKDNSALTNGSPCASALGGGCRPGGEASHQPRHSRIRARHRGIPGPARAL